MTNYERECAVRLTLIGEGTMKPKETWSSAVKENPVAARNAILECAAAEQFLLAAVERTDVDWCLARLKQVKKTKGNLPTMLDALLPVPEPKPC